VKSTKYSAHHMIHM